MAISGHTTRQTLTVYSGASNRLVKNGARGSVWRRDWMENATRNALAVSQNGARWAPPTIR